MALSSGTVLNNRYHIVNLLGQGGFGAVYKAWDLNLKGTCAVKENFDTSPEAARQFETEAVLLSNLRHAGLPVVRDHFILSGQGQYLVMDYIEGHDLQSMMDSQQGPLPEIKVVEWISQVCDALEYLHSQKPPVIHRDIKPANIRLTADGQAILVDFGIAKTYDPGKKTTVGARAVTPGYSPYEQYGQASTDARTDVYALGATAYMLLTNSEPLESIQRVSIDTLVPVNGLNPKVSTHTAIVIGKAMKVKPILRFQTALEFKQALNSQQFVTVTQVRPNALARRRPPVFAPPPPQLQLPLPPSPTPSELSQIARFVC